MNHPETDSSLPRAHTQTVPDTHRNMCLLQRSVIIVTHLSNLNTRHTLTIALIWLLSVSVTETIMKSFSCKMVEATNTISTST